MDNTRVSTSSNATSNDSEHFRESSSDLSSGKESLKRGRFADYEKPNIKLLLLAMWDGFLLKCPSCSEGRIYDGFATVRRSCPHCEAPFERYGEGDFVGAMVLAYSFASIFVTNVILVINMVTTMPVWDQIIIAALAGLAFVVLLYRNMKGVWVAILLALLRWMG